MVIGVTTQQITKQLKSVYALEATACSSRYTALDAWTDQVHVLGFTKAVLGASASLSRVNDTEIATSPHTWANTGKLYEWDLALPGK